MSPSSPEIMGDRKRPVETEGFSNRLFIHRISQWLVPYLQRMGVHPNLVSMTGMTVGLCAAPMYFYLPYPLAAPGVLLCFLFWLIMDGADGKLARATGKASAAGHVIDGIADYSVFVAYYTIMAFGTEPERGTAILWITAAAGASHIIQAASFEAERERYFRWTTSGSTAPSDSDDTLSALPFPLSFLKSGYDWLQRRFRSGLPDRGTVALAPETVANIYRLHFTALVRRWGVLSANSHAFAIFLFALAGIPEGYFLFEVIAFNGVLVLLFLRRRNAIRSFNLSLGDALQNVGERRK